MTTIAYRDGRMASDSMLTHGDIRAAFARKIFRSKKGDLVGVSGAMASVSIFQRWAEQQGCDMAHLPKSDLEDFEYTALWVKPDGAVHLIDNGHATQVYGPYVAIGSGEPFALGAMAFGASAEQAVLAAIAHDCGSGGQIVIAELPKPVEPAVLPDNVVPFKRK